MSICDGLGKIKGWLLVPYSVTITGDNHSFPSIISRALTAIQSMDFPDAGLKIILHTRSALMTFPQSKNNTHLHRSAYFLK